MELRFSRRNFLASSTLASLSALPFLRAVTPEARAAQSPQFLLTYFFPFGVVSKEWYPEQTGRDFSLANKKSSSPLEAIRDDIIMFRNIDNAMGEKNECAHSIDQHHAAVSSLWTNAAMDGGPAYCGEPSDKRFNTCDRPRPGGPSIDSVIARHLAPNLHHDDVVANLGVRSTEYEKGHTRWLHQKVDGTTVDAQDDPRVSFAELFAGSTKKLGLVEPEKPFAGLKEAMLDDLLVYEQRLALPERERFQLYMDAFKTFEDSLDVVMSQENLCKDLPTEQQVTAGFDAVRAENIWPIVTAQSKLAVLAMGCGIRRVATLHLTDGFSTYFIPKGPNDVEGSDTGHLGISHKQSKNATEKWVNLNYHQAKNFADMIQEMKAMPSPVTGGATLFDDTIALYASGQSGNGGGGHSKMRSPFTMAAGKNAGWVTGRHLDANFGTVGMALRSVCNAFGMPDQPFGEEEFSYEPMGGLDSDAEIAGNYERGVLQYLDGTSRCRGHAK